MAFKLYLKQKKEIIEKNAKVSAKVVDKFDENAGKHSGEGVRNGMEAVSQSVKEDGETLSVEHASAS